MNRLVMAVLAFGCLLGSSNALAQANWDNSDTTISMDSGVAGRTFKAVTTCSSFGASWVNGTGAGVCNDGDPCTRDTTYGKNPAYDKTCCKNLNILCPNGQLLSQSEIERIDSTLKSEESENLGNVFTSNVVDTFWGYVSSTNRSPNAGRGNSAHAKLDACLFYSDVDNLGTGYTGWDTCKNSTTLGCNASNKNEYCMSSGASVCEDRCDCVFTGFASCEGL